MLSFIKEEPPFIWPEKTSVLGELDDGFSAWPFKFDWNGLHRHDFQLLELPSPVLLDVMKLVGRKSRRALSFTCQKLRNMILNNESPEMDRRRVRQICINIIDDEIEIEFMDGYSKYFWTYVSLADVTRLVEFLHFVGRVNFFIRVLIFFDLPKFDLSLLVASLENMTNHVNIVWQDEYKVYPPPEATKKMVDAFITHSYVRFVNFGSFLPPEFDEYCKTVRQWAIAEGFHGTRKNGCSSSFEKYGYEEDTFITLNEFQD